MPDDDDTRRQAPVKQQGNTNGPRTSIFQVPAPLKRVFDRFPLVTYEANELPQRAPRLRQDHVLHVFTTYHDAANGAPSFNPGCLKWQTYLRIVGLQFRVVPSTNHASPSGTLPFLQPAASSPDASVAVDPIPSNKLKKWLLSQPSVKKPHESEDNRYDAYASLLDNRIRKAWLFQLYLAPQNAALARRLYVNNCSSQPLVQIAITRQLRAAAEAELVKSAATNHISALDVIRDAEEAFNALSVLLGYDEWFFGHHAPGLFDASVFAYTHLVLDERLGWNYNPLEESLTKHQNLVQHCRRIERMYL